MADFLWSWMVNKLYDVFTVFCFDHTVVEFSDYVYIYSTLLKLRVALTPGNSSNSVTVTIPKDITTRLSIYVLAVIIYLLFFASVGWHIIVVLRR